MLKSKFKSSLRVIKVVVKVMLCALVLVSYFCHDSSSTWFEPQRLVTSLEWLDILLKANARANVGLHYKENNKIFSVYSRCMCRCGAHTHFIGKSKLDVGQHKTNNLINLISIVTDTPTKANKSHINHSETIAEIVTFSCTGAEWEYRKW